MREIFLIIEISTPGPPSTVFLKLNFKGDKKSKKLFFLI